MTSSEPVNAMMPHMSGVSGGAKGGSCGRIGGQQAVDEVLARPHEAVTSVQYARKPEVFQVDRFSRLPRSRFGQG